MRNPKRSLGIPKYSKVQNKREKNNQQRTN